jgi:hypothetical protein
MSTTIRRALLTTLIIALGLPPVFGQAPEATARPGQVVGAEVIRLEGDGSVAAGATMGGLIGLTYGRSRDHSRAVTRRRTALGAAAGGRLARRAGGGAQEAFEYKIQMLDGELVRFVTDQDGIRMGDCVVIEEARGTHNIRRVSDLMCLEQSQAVVGALQPDLVAEADKCAQAKQQLLEAETDAEIDRAVIRVSILCDD